MVSLSSSLALPPESKSEPVARGAALRAGDEGFEEIFMQLMQAQPQVVATEQCATIAKVEDPEQGSELPVTENSDPDAEAVVDPPEPPQPEVALAPVVAAPAVPEVQTAKPVALPLSAENGNVEGSASVDSGPATDSEIPAEAEHASAPRASAPATPDLASANGSGTDGDPDQQRAPDQSGNSGVSAPSSEIAGDSAARNDFRAAMAQSPDTGEAARLATQVRDTLQRHIPVMQAAEFSMATDPEGPTRLTFDSSELGRLHFAITGEGDALRISVLADRPETLHLLRRETALLREELNAAGYNDARMEFDLGSQDQNRQPQEEYYTSEAVSEHIYVVPAQSPNSLPSTGLDLRY